MTREIPSYLRIHKDEVESTANSSVNTQKLDEVQAILKAFAEATGWNAVPVEEKKNSSRRRTTSKSSTESPLIWELQSAIPIDGIMDVVEDDLIPAVSQSAAQKLIDSIGQLLVRLEKAERAVWRQEAELATGVGVSWKPEEQEQLATKLESSLQSAASTIRCDAAAMYLLDETTSVLKMRSCVGLSPSKLAEPPRNLRGSLADLEALLGNAVLMEDIQAMPQWNSPEVFGAGLCVPLGSVHMPQGTLWFWSETRRNFSSAEIEIAKMAARELMADIERCVLGSEVSNLRSVSHQIDAAGLLQSSLLPDRQPLDRRFDIAGWSHHAETVGGNFHAWNLLPTGQIAAAVGASKSSGMEGCITATMLQTTLENLWQHRPTPPQVLRRANDLFWSRDEGDWSSSLGYLHLDPETGNGSFANAGATQAWIICKDGFRPLGSTGPTLGLQPDPVFNSHRFTLQSGECILIASPKIICERGNKKNAQDLLLAAVRETISKSATHISDHLAQLFYDANRFEPADRSIVVIKRKGK